MKIIIYSMYMIAVSLLLVSLLGGSITKTIVEGISMKTMQAIGIDKSKIDTLDSEIDKSIYNMNLIMYKIEKFKNIISFSDEYSKPLEFKKYFYLNNTVYEPLKTTITFFLRVVMSVAGIFLLMLTAIIHTVSSYFNLRKRVRLLEEKILNPQAGIYQN
jgi:hypothetical protein